MSSNTETRDPKTYAIIGVAMEVHGELGCGFLEAVYQEALGMELSARGVPHKAQMEIPVYYKGQKLNSKYRADFICYDSIVVEIKAVSTLMGAEEAQVLHYLRATGHKVGLLLNFGRESLQFKRLVF